jgi:hypothetical protein
MADFESNLIPFEVIGDDTPEPRTGVEIVVYAPHDLATPLDIIPRVISPTFLSEVNRPGGGNITLSKLDSIFADTPNILDYRNVVKCKLDQKVVGAFVIQRKKNVIVGRGENAELAVQARGEGLRTWLNDGIVLAAGGLKQRSPKERVFSFASEQGTWYDPADWVPATNVAQYSMEPGNGSPWGTAPAEWPDAPGAFWIWDRDEVAPPIGYCYFRYEFDIDVSVGTKEYSLFTSADDEFEVYVDAGRVTEVKEEYAWSQTYRADFTLDPGHHVIAARVRNLRGAAGFIAAFFRVGDATADPPIPAVLLNTTGQPGWVVNGYPDPAPGWSPGEIMLTLLSELEPRNVWMAETLVPTFTATHDSDGVAWPRALDWSFTLGSTLTTVVEKLEELVCDVWIDPDTYELNMAVTRGVHRDEQTVGQQPVVLEIGKNLLKAEEEGEADLKNALLMDVADGYEYFTDSISESEEKYGRLEGYVSGQASASVAGDVAQATFEKVANPTESATFKVIDTEDARPFRDYFEGDWLLAPGDEGLEPRRVMSISFTVNRVGKPDFEIEFDTILEDQGERLERWLKTTSDGTLGGTVANSGGGSGTPTPAIPLPKTGAAGPAGPPGPPGVLWRGAWGPGIEYAERDLVSYLGSSYIAVEANDGIEPTDDAPEWDLVAQGSGIVILGALANTGLLPATDNEVGDAYIISGHLWVWDGDSWDDAGTVQGPAGATGATGGPGPQGDSAYQIALDNGFVGTEAEWLASLEGPQGDVGPAGPGLIILGELADPGDLPSSGNDPGDAYIIDGDLWVWSSTEGWQNVGNLQGPQGVPGGPGPQGDSAYEVAVAEGFVGTEAEWLASLEGPEGDQGLSAYAVAVANGFVGTQSEWLESLVGPAGPSAYQAALDNGFVGTESEWLESLIGEPGPQGPPGDGLVILGTFSDPGSLPGTGDPGDAYMIAGELWIWSTLLSDWENVGPITGVGGSGGGGGFAAGNYVKTTPALLPESVHKSTFTMSAAEAHNVLVISADRPCRVRFYVTIAQQDADELRSPAMDVYGNHGVLLDIELTEDMLTKVVSPAALIWSAEGYGAVPVSITNNSLVESSVTVTVTAKGLPGAAQGGTDATEYVKTTGSLADDASEASTFTLSAAEIHHGLEISTSVPARVRFYSTIAQRDADLARAVGAPLVGNHGLLLETRLLAGDLSRILAPAATLFNATDFGAIPVTITNESGATSAVTVTLTAKGV